MKVKSNTDCKTVGFAHTHKGLAPLDPDTLQSTATTEENTMLHTDDYGFTPGTYVRRCDENGVKSGPIGRVIRVCDDPFEVTYLVGWPEGARWESCLYLDRVGEWRGESGRERFERMAARAAHGSRSAYELGERIPETVMDDSHTRTGRVKPSSDEELWDWQETNHLPSGRPLSEDARIEALPVAHLAVVREAAARTRGAGGVRRWSDSYSSAEIAETLSAMSRKSKEAVSSATWRAVREELEEMLVEARELDDRTFHSQDVSESRVQAEDDRDLDDAIWAARMDARYESEGPMPTRAIGTLADELAARAHRMMEWLIVHDRRAVIVKRPQLIPDPDRSDRWILQEASTTKHFYATEVEARAKVGEIRAWASARGPVRVYRPDALKDDPTLSPKVREWRRERREWLARNSKVRVGRRFLTVRRKRWHKSLNSPVLPAWAHLEPRKEVTA